MTIDLSRYIGRHEERLVRVVQSRLGANTSPALDPHLIRKDASDLVSTEEVIAFLEHLLADGLIFADDVKHCISEQCSKAETGHPLTSEELEASRCGVCDQDFADTGEPYEQRYYSKRSPISRDIRWMIVIHGFNTKGPWQEELGWVFPTSLRMLHRY